MDMGRTAEQKEELRRRIEEVRGWCWWHEIDLGDGILTPSTNTEEERLRTRYHKLAALDRANVIPRDLTGWRVLDVGAASGGYSVKFCERGADEVVAVAVEVNDGGLSEAFFNDQVALVRQELALNNLTPKLLPDGYSFDKAELGEFDLIWYAGVLYHAKHPYRQLELLTRLCRRWLVIESAIHVDPQRQGYMRFIEKNLGSETSGLLNWWEPDPECIMAMCRTLGYEGVRQIWRDDEFEHVVQPGRAMFVARRPDVD